MYKITTKTINKAFLLALFTQISCLKANLAIHNNPECTHFLDIRHLDKDIISTDAGDINFALMKVLSDNPMVFQKVDKISIEDHTITLVNGSVWKVSNIDAVRGWDKYENLVITQNHATFSTHKFGLVNTELRLAEPVSLLTPPLPNHQDALFIKKIDPTHDIVVLNNDKEFVVHTRDHGILNKFSVNSPVLVGVNTMDECNSNPNIIVDASLNAHGYVRAATNPIPK